jgi:hypothetical protein
MSKRLTSSDGRAIDLLLDQVKRSGEQESVAFAQPDGDVQQRVQSASPSIRPQA